MITKVQCIHQGFELYGSDKTFLQCVSTLALNGEWEVDVALPRKGTLSERICVLPVSLNIVSMLILRKSDGIGGLLRLLLRLPFAAIKAAVNCRKYDLIYINSLVLIDQVVASIFVKNKFVLHVHEIPTGLAGRLFSFLLKFSRANIIYNSNATKSAMAADGVVLLNGVSNNDLVCCQNDIQGSSSEFPALKLLMIGRFNSWKGQGLLVEALRRLALESNANFILKFVGGTFDGQSHYIEDVNSAVLKSGLAGQVEFSEFDADTEKFYLWADVVVVPSTKPEPFGLVAAEAMSYGRAVIAANHGGLAEVVVHNETGLLFAQGQVESLQAAIKIYLHDRSLCRLHGQSGHRRQQKHFSEENFAENFSAILGAAAARAAAKY